MKATMVVLAALMVTSEVSGQTTCQLGTALAVNPGRQLAPGEKEVTATGGVVTLTQRERAGSSHIVLRRCILPAGTKLACGPAGCWVRVCGNDVVATEGWTLPGVGIVGAEGPQGKRGDPGIPVVSTPLLVGDLHCPAGGTRISVGSTTEYLCNGRDGAPGRAGLDFTPTPAPQKSGPDLWPCNNSRGWRVGCWTVGLVGAGLVVKNNWPDGDKGKPPEIETKPTVARCTATSYPNTCPGPPTVGNLLAGLVQSAQPSYNPATRRGGITFSFNF